MRRRTNSKGLRLRATREQGTAGASRARIAAAGLVAATLVLNPGSASAQGAPPLDVSLSADTVQMGTVFELTVEVPVPAGSVVHFPDTLPATANVESAGPVRAAAVGSAEGAATLSLTYPLMAFGAGTLPVPGLDVLVAPREGRTGDGEIPGGSAFGAWSDAPRQPGAARIIRVPRQAVWVVPVFSVRDIAEGVEPMAPNDVAGGSWSWPSLALALLCSSLLVLTLASTTKGWIEHARAPGGPPPPPTLAELRQRALDELDALLADGLPAEERALERYTRGTDTVRRYVEALDTSWSESLTSSELMARLQERSGEEAAGVLPPELGAAEVVKFGRARPGATTAERHWRALRAWVAGSGSPPS